MPSAIDPAVTLGTPLPQQVEPGKALAVFAYGSVDDEPWWELLRVPALTPGETVELQARGAPIGSVTAGPEPVPAPGGDPAGKRVAVCLTTFQPDEALLRTQIESIRAQDFEDWHCVIVDDGSGPETLALIDRVMAGDARFTVHALEDRVGFYGNFERALRLVPADAELIALSDHDDRWHPDKLSSLVATIGDATLVYSDMRLTGPDGHVYRDTLWRGRRNDYADLTSMLVANTVTGAAAMFRADLLDVALPFPGPLGVQFHDHWLACCALALGDLAYVDRPLYDYVQHSGAVFGEVSVGERRRRTPGAARAAYFYGYLGRVQFAATLLDRGGSRISPEKRASLERFVAAERSPSGLLRLVGRAIKHRLRPSSTLGTEQDIVSGILWRRAAAIGLARDRSLPDPLAAQQQRLRRWRSAL